MPELISLSMWIWLSRWMGVVLSDPNGDSLTYGWTQTGGPVVSLSDATASSPDLYLTS